MSLTRWLELKIPPVLVWLAFGGLMFEIGRAHV